MTDRQKVIKGLTECVAAGLEKACSADCPYFLKCFPDVGLATPFMSLMQDALALLKEQEAKPMLEIEDDDLYAWSPEDISYYCPRPECGKEISYDYNFCPYCGQAVKLE